MIWTPLPKDFGTSGYYERRSKTIEAHLQWLSIDKHKLLWSFNYWIDPSTDLRQYLWAHRPHDVTRAQEIISILPAATLIDILRYLIQSYWDRYLGWPDMLVYSPEEFFFAEVKSSKDQLSEVQKRWIYDNNTKLHLPFKLVKIHKKNNN